MKLVFLGPPGAGKGTIAAMVTKEFETAHISTGDMLREQIKNGTELGLKAKGFIDAGQLVPDDVIIGMVKVRLAEPDCAKGFILDGFPRTVEQAKALDEIIHLDAVVNFDADEETVVKRVSGRRVCQSCGEVSHVKWLKEGQNTCDKCAGRLIIRPDDNEETMRNRLAVYKKQTAPLIDYYDEKGVLRKTDANADVEDCFRDVLHIIEKL
jgi:adenylate kinase